MRAFHRHLGRGNKMIVAPGRGTEQVGIRISPVYPLPVVRLPSLPSPLWPVSGCHPGCGHRGGSTDFSKEAPGLQDQLLFVTRAQHLEFPQQCAVLHCQRWCQMIGPGTSFLPFCLAETISSSLDKAAFHGSKDSLPSTLLFSLVLAPLFSSVSLRVPRACEAVMMCRELLCVVLSARV